MQIGEMIGMLFKPHYPPFFAPWMRPPSGPPSPSLSQHSLPTAEAAERLSRRGDDPRPHHRKHKKSAGKAAKRQTSQDLSTEEQEDDDVLSSASNKEVNRGTRTFVVRLRVFAISLARYWLATYVTRAPSLSGNTTEGLGKAPPDGAV